MAQGGIPLSEWSGSGATRELHETIKQFNAAAERQTAQMLALTRQIKWLTWAMLLAAAVQIYLAAKP